MALGWKFASFSDVVRREAHRRRLDPESRETLQSLGSELIDQGWKKLCQAVLEDADWRGGEGLVIDGIRHVEALETLRVLVSPLPLFLVYVRIDERMRKARLLERNGYGEQRLRRIDQHETESQVKAVLAGVADLVVDGALPVEIATRKILKWLANHMALAHARKTSRRKRLY